MPGDSNCCPELRPTKAQFARPFVNYVSEFFRKNPEVPIVKVIPPKGYTPRTSCYPKDLKIDTPIEQRVLMHDNKPGYYDCVLVSQPTLTVDEFQQIAAKRGVPKQGRDGDELLERPFWSSLTVKPPLYGADTPQSLFDKKLDFGWNLRSLGCLLSKHKVPAIPGVTTPMTYFGMWKSFFSWHVEDVDLLSINYLHYGASKVWYAIPPGVHRKRFENLAKELFPNDAAACSNFLRHKTILITPNLLKHHTIPFVTVKHNPGEFVVLNAGAYHAGFNQGFNCAEAVNFATKDWIPLGKHATRCDCKALGKDAVRVNMTVFPGCQDCASSSSDNSGEDSKMESVDSDEGSSNAPKRKAAPPKKAPRKTAKEQKVAGKRGPGRPRKHPLPADRESLDSNTCAAHSDKLRAKASQLKVKAAAKQVAKGKGGKAKPAAEVGRNAAGKAVDTTRRQAGDSWRETQDSQGHLLPKADKEREDTEAGRPSDSGRQAKHGEAADGTHHSKKKRGQQDDSGSYDHPQPASKRRRREAEVQLPKQVEEKVKRKPGRPRKHPKPDAAPLTSKAGAQLGESSSRPQSGRPLSAGTRGAAAAMEALDAQVVGQPYVIVGKDDTSGKKYFYLVQKLSKPAAHNDQVVVRWLEERGDGLWHPSAHTWTEATGALCDVRTQLCRDKSGRPCYKLLTLRSKIEAVELED